MTARTDAERKAAQRQNRKRRLERAGFIYVAGWLRPEFGKRAQAQIDAYREEVERIANEDAPRGRPPTKP